MQSRHVVLARRPEGAPVAADFRVETRELPPLADGRVMVEVLYTTANPGSRGRLSGGAGYARPLNIGETMEGPAIGRVIESKNKDFAVGDLLWGLSGWAEHLQVSGRGMQKIPKDTTHLSAWAGILNIPGLTAYFGLRDVGAAKAGETVLISSAAGAVGATAGQIARIMGCRVIGIASGDERHRWLREEAKFDAVIDRRETPDIEQLGVADRRRCPRRHRRLLRQCRRLCARCRDRRDEAARPHRRLRPARRLQRRARPALRHAAGA